MSDSPNDEPGAPGDMRRILSGIRTLQLDVVSIKTELTALRTDLMMRIDRLQDALTDQRQSDVVNFGAGERAEQIAKATRDETRLIGEQLSDLSKLVLRLKTRMDQLEEGRGDGKAS